MIIKELNYLLVSLEGQNENIYFIYVYHIYRVNYNNKKLVIWN